MIDFTFFGRERGREEAKHIRRPFITATYLFATNPTRASSLLVSLNRVTHRSRIRGPAVTFIVTARFRCIFFQHHVRDPEQWEPVQHGGEGAGTALAVLRSKETRAGRHALSTVKCGLG